DRLFDGGGTGLLRGGVGNDTYYVDNTGDQVIEATGEGNDTVYTSVDYTLASGQEIENLSAGAGAIGLTLSGNEFANASTGGGAHDPFAGRYRNDRLDEGLGTGNMSGGVGNDTYYVDNTGDQVIEATGEGNDTVYTSVDYTLASGQEIENLSASAGAIG